MLQSGSDRYQVLVDALSDFVRVTDAAGWRESIHPEDRAVFDAQWAVGTAMGSVFTIEGRSLSESGEYRHCIGRAAPLRDDDGYIVEWMVAAVDIHERYERERTQAERFRRIFGANVFAICYAEGDRILDGNRAFYEMIGTRRSQARDGIDANELILIDGVGGIEGLHNEHATECQIMRRDGTVGHAIGTAVPLTPDTGWLAVFVDVSARKAAEEEVRHLSLHDPLTGLPNRRLLFDRLTHALARAARRRSSVGVLFVDLDRFKEVNDVFGHDAGDHVLLEVSDRLGRLMREADTVGRIGGDEFVVVLEDLTAPDDAALIADRMREALAEPIAIGDRSVVVGASIGIAVGSGDCEAEVLLADADEAMYSEKNRASGISVETPVAFQPVIDLREGKAVAAAVADAMPVERAIRVAGAEFARWRLTDPDAHECRLHVAVTARDIEERDFVDRVVDAITDAGFSTGDVCLEFTGDLADATDLTALRDRGVGVVVKIDGRSVAELSRSEEARDRVEQTIDRAHQLDILVIGEGVETLAQMTILGELGCDRAQGALIGRPGPVEQISVAF